MVSKVIEKELIEVLLVEAMEFRFVVVGSPILSLHSLKSWLNVVDDTDDPRKESLVDKFFVYELDCEDI